MFRFIKANILVCFVIVSLDIVASEKNTRSICWTALDSAVSRGDLQLAESALKNGADPNRADCTNFTYLFTAVYYENIELTALLIKYGAQVNQQNNANNTPLHFAAKEGNLKLVELLLSHGAGVDMVNNHKLTPLGLVFNKINILHEAHRFTGELKERYEAIVKLLLEHSRSIAYQNNKSNLASTQLTPSPAAVVPETNNQTVVSNSSSRLPAYNHDHCYYNPNDKQAGYLLYKAQLKAHGSNQNEQSNPVPQCKKKLACAFGYCETCQKIDK